MACNITGGISLDCIDGIGGIKTAYISTNAQITSTAGVTGTSGKLYDVGGTGTFYTFEIPKDTSSFSETANIAPSAGTVFYTQELSLVFHKLAAAKRDQILLLAKNRNMKVVFEDNNGQFWFMGLDRGVQVSAATAVTGVNPGDANQYTITLQAMEPSPVYELTGLEALADFTIS